MWFPELNNRITEGSSSTDFCEIIASRNPTEVNGTLIKAVSLDCNLPVVHDQMFLNNMILGVVYMGCFLSLGLSLNKISLKRTLTSVLIMATICAFVLQHITNSVLVLIVFCFMIIGGGISIPLVNATAVDLFPTNLRGMAISMSILIGRMGTVTGANSLGFLLDMNCGLTFYGVGVLTAGELLQLIKR